MSPAPARTRTPKPGGIAAILAHPDDESFGCAGALALTYDADVETSLLVVTRGEAGTSDGEPDEEFGGQRELELMKAVVDKAAAAVFAEKGRTIDYLCGTMIELPRAALRAAEIAEVGEFFSFGTNDLTQTTLGVSRDDAGRFLTAYVEKGIYARDPFVSIDVEGVGELIALAAERGRSTRSDIKLGICGEHGGDPASIHFCESVGLDYVSASPYRVPIARLAAAQAALKAR